MCNGRTPIQHNQLMIEKLKEKRRIATELRLKRRIEAFIRFEEAEDYD